MPIDQERAEAATQWLIDNASAVGLAKARATFASNSLRRVKAFEILKSEAKSISLKEAEAYASDKYGEALTEEYEAVKEFETLKAAKEAARETIEIWRSINSNQRAAERGYGSHR